MPQKVLLVEDSVAFSAVVQNSIEQAHGYKVDVATSLAETEVLLEKSGTEYFAAIVDYHLPDAPDGEALESVKKYDIPAVVFTGSKDTGLKEDLWGKGIADYAHKQGPHNLEYVVWLINRLYLNTRVHVLVVDDSRVTRRAIERLLRTQRFNVHVVDSGEAALEYLAGEHDIKIAIIDCNMEGMTGIELTNRIREKHSVYKLEVIGISSEGGSKLSAQFIKAGANDFVLKPFLPEELLCRVNKSIDRIEDYEELQHLNQLKNQFLGTAAHDIRGPLAAIKTASDYMLRGSCSEERSQTLLEMIKSNSSSLIELLETLLDISIIESGDLSLNLQEINLSNLVKERIYLYQAEANTKHLECKTEISEDVVCTIDPVKIRQLVDNLITNAIKYSNPNGEFVVTLRQSHGKWKLAIQDAGPGIERQEQKKLFKPYAGISTEATGGERQTGLGLVIAKSVVDAHHGRISYRHDENLHSTFFVEIPLQPPVEEE